MMSLFHPRCTSVDGKTSDVGLLIIKVICHRCNSLTELLNLTYNDRQVLEDKLTGMVWVKTLELH